jgi:hypothetical protein
VSRAAAQPKAHAGWRELPWLSLVVLSVALGLSCGIASSVVYPRHGVAGVVAAAIAAGVCWASASAALCVTACLSGPRAVQGLLLSIVLRTVPPLVVGLAFSVTNRSLASAGILWLVLVHYFVALAVETPLAVRLVRRREAGRVSTGTVFGRDKSTASTV